jgi:hypothetical protein
VIPRLALALALWGAPATALACGQSTHIWTSLHARDAHLPPGPLRDLMMRADLEPMIVHGTMFPDGGYSPFNRHPYGEASHWAPFHDRYLAHIQATWADVDSEEAAPHVAFLMGLMAHGIGDEFYDAAYMERSKHIDAWSSGDFDTATDVVMMAEQEPVPKPETWAPFELFPSLFDDIGIDVDAGTLRGGQAALVAAVGIVEHGSQQPDIVQGHRDTFPWGTSHLSDPTVPGSASCIGEVIAQHWAITWARLHDDFDPATDPVMASVPAAGAYEVEARADDPTTMLHLITSLAIGPGDPASFVRLEGPDGEVPVSVRLFYGNTSHVLNVTPLEDLADDSDYVLHLDEGVPTWDEALVHGAAEIPFSTGPAPDPADARKRRSACNHAGPLGPGAGWVGIAALGLLLRRRT